ncbi:MAG: nucleotidyltransferase domain-containing protein [Candidatus Nanoarchaeia archaeon]|nr:nucleotidyltransferase domain-containing protein [Candidatus Nanoarchaeia archaeon]MDD5587617.1 nucleotidyltransferase domain-containing protein [Candidatus Nanoarchaeia archaeon]
METKITILKSFFEDPNRRFSLRELSRILKINHTTVRQYLNKFVKEGYLSVKKEGVYSFYQLILSRNTLNLKLYFNLEKLRTSNIINDLEKVYDFPVVVLFGSYASATDDKTSDIDICVISNIKKEFPTEKYEKILYKKVNIEKFNKKDWEKTIKTNPYFINNICNGIVLSGELEVFQ